MKKYTDCKPRHWQRDTDFLCTAWLENSQIKIKWKNRVRQVEKFRNRIYVRITIVFRVTVHPHAIEARKKWIVCYHRTVEICILNKNIIQAESYHIIKVCWWRVFYGMLKYVNKPFIDNQMLSNEKYCSYLDKYLVFYFHSSLHILLRILNGETKKKQE